MHIKTHFVISKYIFTHLTNIYIYIYIYNYFFYNLVVGIFSLHFMFSNANFMGNTILHLLVSLWSQWNSKSCDFNNNNNNNNNKFYGRFKRLINNISHQKTWTWLRKWNFKRETESLLIAAQDNAIRTNHIKARINKTQQNRKCRLCGDRDETINHIISECSKLEQDYEARHDWVSKVVHWEMCRKFQFDHANKWSTQNPAPVRENDSHKLLWDINVQTDHLIPARRPNLKIINKKRESAKLSTFLSRQTTE